ncbi:DUF177 domain-containing protein [Williamsia sp. 1135]|uniref:YceD family protein n=1 Tax=Williamsia sp. 1135 TaxID=1889262 RepID=UPI001F0AE2DB|nr:DUF177 domain-containing protein [Williamsia sp. 1135]
MSQRESKQSRHDRTIDGPFTLDIRSLGRRAGSMREVHRAITPAPRIGLDMIAIPAGSDVDLDLRLEAVSEGVLVTGCVSGETEGQCVRCLEPIAGTASVYVTELYAYPNSATEQTTDAEDIHRIVDDKIDLEQAVVDAVALDLPNTPLCRPDCPGLCPECGIRLDLAEPGHQHEVIDPRWAGLASKFAEDPESKK